MSQVLHAPRTTDGAGVAKRISLQTSGVRLFAAYWGSLAIVDLTGQLLVVSLVSLVAWVGVCSIRQRPFVAAAVGLIGWCFLNGFVVNRYGDLEVHTPVDLVWLATMAAAALAAAGMTHPVRR